jgi:hypothetical protein
MKESLPDKLSTVKQKIIRFLIEGDILLSADEEKVLARWETADELLREKKPFTEICTLIVEKHHVSRFTAQNDVFAAQEVYGQARRLDKRYVLFLKYQRQEEDIEKIRKKLFKVDPETNDFLMPDAKELMALAKLEEAITYTLNSFPQESIVPPIKRPVFFFQTINNSLNAPMPVEDAMIKADAIIKKLSNDDRTS